MKLSELRPHIRRMIREELETVVQERLREELMRAIGEVYIRGLVEEVSAGRGAISEASAEPPPRKRRAASVDRSQMVQMVARQQPTAPVLSDKNPLRDIYEGVQPIDDEATTPSIPLEAMGLDLERMRRLNKRLIED